MPLDVESSGDMIHFCSSLCYFCLVTNLHPVGLNTLPRVMIIDLHQTSWEFHSACLIYALFTPLSAIGLRSSLCLLS